jgi:hypothetical protein
MEVILWHSEELATGPYPGPNELGLQPPILFLLRSVLILSFLSPICATYPVNLILFDYDNIW